MRPVYGGTGMLCCWLCSRDRYAAFCSTGENGSSAVSYTHLYVYKRQNLNGSEFQNMFQKECESLWAGAVSPEEFAKRVAEQAAPIVSK